MDVITVHTSMQTIFLVARNPQATDWLSENLGHMMGAVADISQKELPVTPSLAPLLAPITSDRHVYTIPRMIVAKPKRTESWAPWREPELGTEFAEKLASMVRDGLSSEIKTWGLDAPAAHITIIDEGRPMPISPATGPRGMARLGVKFVSNRKIEGALFVGLQAISGNGWVHRSGTMKNPAGRSQEVLPS